MKSVYRFGGMPTGIRTVQERLGHSDVGTTLIDTHVRKVAAGGTATGALLSV
jgi:integrase